MNTYLFFRNCLTLRDNEVGSDQVADLLYEAQKGQLVCQACFMTLMEMFYRIWKDEGEMAGRLAYEQCVALPISPKPMNKKTPSSDWAAIESKLKRETKATLIQLVRELTAVSPTTHRFLHTRYLTKQTAAQQIAPYRQLIKAQFVISEWDNSVGWNFVEVQKAIDDYDQSSQGDEIGLCELLVVALETAVSFADSLNLQADDFDSDVTELAERCADHLYDQPQLLPKYVRRLKKVAQKGDVLGYYALGESFDKLLRL
ncbi:hypothetical protein MNBD_CHLOROFLEXI01-858 [hydrothermal vent metagenome]|uniref:Uncharacterized protein n=1 Tax=hydrothermal vent metagenome TaxID=652676 RepID=A0A3B0VF92_9ZZZZ